MKRITNILLILLSTQLTLVAQQTTNKIIPYKNPALAINDRVKDLLGRMTLEEKVYQMCALRLGDGDEVFKTSGVYNADYIRKQMKTHGVGHISCPTTDMNSTLSLKTANEIQKIAVDETRLGIPILINDEALHGYKGNGSTFYPQSIAMSCTWNLPLMQEVSDAIGKETYSRGIRQILSPVLDLARDPRHGRMEETYGEDPFLASRFGVEYIKAVQAQGGICSPKHFVANFAAPNGFDSGNIDLTERTLRELHFIPYEAAVREGQVKSLMAAYNALDGIPCTANYWLLTTVLRKEWGFKGFTISDWSGVNHIMGNHKVENTLAGAAVLASRAGMDVDLPRLKSYIQLIEQVKLGKIKETEIDENVKRILHVKFAMGLFENPYVQESTLINEPAFRKLALKAARESIILMKNKNDILPIASSAKNIAVIGPNANKLQLGGYSARNVKGVTPLEGIKNIFADKATIRYAKGCNLTGTDRTGFAEAISIAKEADICVLVMGGEYGITGGESQDRVDLNLMGQQEELIKQISAQGKPVVVVLNDGRPVTMLNWIDKVDGVLFMFPAGEEGGNALAEILAGKVNPSGKTTITIPRHTGQLPMPLITRPYGREGSVAEYPEMNREKFSVNNRYYPLFPFGFGLSYTSFKYSNIRFVKDKIGQNEKIQVMVDVTNTGQMDGDEIVQLYFSNLHCRLVSQPKQQLRAFQRISIAKGQTKIVKFTLPTSALTYLDENLKPRIDPGEFEIFIGTNALEGLKANFTLIK